MQTHQAETRNPKPSGKMGETRNTDAAEKRNPKPKPGRNPGGGREHGGDAVDEDEAGDEEHAGEDADEAGRNLAERDVQSTCGGWAAAKVWGWAAAFLG